jgi:hypothetical protein
MNKPLESANLQRTKKLEEKGTSNTQIGKLRIKFKLKKWFREREREKRTYQVNPKG